MRRRLAALALLLLPLSACSYMAGREEYGPAPDEQSEYDRVPMRARLYSDYTGMRVYTNRPAYVAIFEVVPGSGAVLLYPAYRSERMYVNAGTNRIILNTPRPSSFYLQADFSGSARNTPHHYLLIASRRPLRVQDMQDEPGSLRRQLGFNRFVSLNARQVMNELADLVLPSENDEDWDSDVITVWPEYRTRLADYDGGGYWVNVRCADGFYVTAPLEWMPYACYQRDRNGGNQAPPPAPHDTTGSKPTDTTSVTVPTRHRPEPVGPETGVGQRFAGGRPNIDPSPVFRPGIPEDKPRVEPGASATPADEPQRQPREPRLEPRRFQPHDEPGAGSSDPSPRVASPRREEPTPQPTRDEPRSVQPRHDEPRQAAPPRQEPRREEPRQAEPRREEPRHEEPRREEPRREEPRSAPPERAEPRSAPAPQAPAVSRPEESKKPPQA
jgi:hypothetical protein